MQVVGMGLIDAPKSGAVGEKAMRTNKLKAPASAKNTVSELKRTVEAKEHFEMTTPGGRQETGLPIWKRGLDLGCILLMSPALLIAGVVVSLVIKVGSRGPLLFQQERVGYRGRRFTLYKFRTMKPNAETDSHQRHTQNLIKSHTPMVKLDAQSDPRLIPLGSCLRACGLDELPQLINVMLGEMSLVGPRPCIPYEFDLHEPWQQERYNAAPGLTGLWQVSGKNRTTFDEMVKFDIEYAQKRSLWLDLKILFRTLPAIWQQYSDLRDARSKESDQPVNHLEKSVQSY